MNSAMNSVHLTIISQFESLLFLKLGMESQGSHSDWKTWKNGKAFSSQGKVREF